MRDVETQEYFFQDYLFSLVQSERINKIDHAAAHGITLQVIDRGVDSLSLKQKHVFKKHVLEEFTVENCDRCYCPIPWEEMEGALDSGMCSYCNHMTEKLKDE